MTDVVVAVYILELTRLGAFVADGVGRGRCQLFGQSYEPF